MTDPTQLELPFPPEYRRRCFSDSLLDNLRGGLSSLYVEESLKRAGFNLGLPITTWHDPVNGLTYYRQRIFF